MYVVGFVDYQSDIDLQLGIIKVKAEFEGVVRVDKAVRFK
jgi:hypothetical protein